MLKVDDIAIFFRTKEVLSHKKLQKLVYYSYAWYIALNNEDVNCINKRICDKTKFEAWVHGPVNRKLYSNYVNDYNEIPKSKITDIKITSPELLKFLNTVYNVFGKYSGDELEVMTHNDAPWINARKGLKSSEPSTNAISEEDMFLFYNAV